MQAFRYARRLSEEGVQILSGMAYGIDTEAHRGALEGEGGTWAVLGNGVDICYPSGNRALYQRILREKCGILSEQPTRTRARNYFFPARNRIISGLCLGVVIIEARERSGAIITAETAIKENREVFAVPGNIFSENSRGCHKLIQEGAKLVNNIEDILVELGNYIKRYGNTDRTCKKKKEGSPEEKDKAEIHHLIKNTDEKKDILRVLDCIGFNEKSIEEIREITKIDKNNLLQILSFLQINDFIFEKSTNNYVLYK